MKGKKKRNIGKETWGRKIGRGKKMKGKGKSEEKNNHTHTKEQGRREV